MYDPDAVSYSLSRGLMATLLIGGQVRQMKATPPEPNNYAVAALQQALPS